MGWPGLVAPWYGLVSMHAVEKRLMARVAFVMISAETPVLVVLVEFGGVEIVEMVEGVIINFVRCFVVVIRFVVLVDWALLS